MFNKLFVILLISFTIDIVHSELVNFKLYKFGSLITNDNDEEVITLGSCIGCGSFTGIFKIRDPPQEPDSEYVLKIQYGVPGKYQNMGSTEHDMYTFLQDKTDGKTPRQSGILDVTPYFRNATLKPPPNRPNTAELRDCEGFGMTKVESDLHTLINDRGHDLLTDDNMVPLISKLVKVVDFLHSQNVIHNDIGPQNIGIFKKFQDVPVALTEDDVCIIDFGLSCFVSPRSGYHKGEKFYVTPETYEVVEEGKTVEKIVNVAAGLRSYLGKAALSGARRGKPTDWDSVFLSFFVCWQKHSWDSDHYHKMFRSISTVQQEIDETSKMRDEVDMSKFEASYCDKTPRACKIMVAIKRCIDVGLTERIILIITENKLDACNDFAFAHGRKPSLASRRRSSARSQILLDRLSRVNQENP